MAWKTCYTIELKCNLILCVWEMCIQFSFVDVPSIKTLKTDVETQTTVLKICAFHTTGGFDTFWSLILWAFMAFLSDSLSTDYLLHSVSEWMITVSSLNIQLKISSTLLTLVIVIDTTILLLAVADWFHAYVNLRPKKKKKETKKMLCCPPRPKNQAGWLVWFFFNTMPCQCLHHHV